MLGRALERFIVGKFTTLFPGTKATNNSGAVSGNGDVIAGPWQIECKGTHRVNIQIKADDWDKARRQAWRHKREPVIIHSARDNLTLATIDLETFLELLQRSPLLSAHDEESIPGARKGTQ